LFIVLKLSTLSNLKKLGPEQNISAEMFSNSLNLRIDNNLVLFIDCYEARELFISDRNSHRRTTEV
jgi:hypothetical protein